MEKDVFSYLEKDYRYLNNYIRDINESLFTAPHTSIIKGRTFAENLTQEIAKIENHGLLSSLSQFDRLQVLEQDGVFTEEINKLFHYVRKLGNKAAHETIEGELEAALNMHKNIYKITCWFVGVYIDPNYEEISYKNPLPCLDTPSTIGAETIKQVFQKTMEDMLIQNKPILQNNEESTSKNESSATLEEHKKDIEQAHTDLMLENIFNNDEPDKKCLVQELAKLKESSKEAVEGLGTFTPFKRYMHIERDAQDDLEKLIKKANESNKAQLILVCGSVGDGKSHIISYFNNKNNEIMQNFDIHNDATESLEPSKTSMDTLNEVLDEFSDEKIENSTQKFILAINLGTLNNFIDSEYGERFTKLKQFVFDKKILENAIEDSNYDENSSFQFVNFTDYHIFNLMDGVAYSKYVKSIMKKITESYEIDSVENNIFYGCYKKHCNQCENKNCCPIKSNYELLSLENVQNSIIDLLVQCIVKNKIIISTRALLNFMYELIIPRSYIDVNSPTFKNSISKLNNQDYIKSLMPNIIFDHKELSFVFEALNSIDPLNVRNEKVDDFIIDFNNTSNALDYFTKYINYSEGYLGKLNNVSLNEIEYKKIRFDLLKLFIRSYYICGSDSLFSLRDKVFDDYMNALYYWNKGDKLKLINVYNNVKDGIMNWNGEADEKYINIFMGKNQIKYKISEKIELKADTTNLSINDRTDINKFIGNLKLKYKGNNAKDPYELDIDYNLYKLLRQVNNGYRPNKKDKNHFIKFIEFMNKLQDTGAKNEEVVFTEKNRENNKKYKLAYDEDFETYRFMEI